MPLGRKIGDGHYRYEAEYKESKKRVVRVLWKWGGPEFVKHNIVRYLG
jgi:hypothetical protein